MVAKRTTSAKKRISTKKGEKPQITIVRTETVPIKDLQVYHANPRVGDLDEIAKSLHVNGLFKPIVVNVGTHTGRENEVLAGNHTMLAARRELTWQAGEKMYEKPAWTHIVCSFVDVDDDTAKRIVLADNATSDKAGYDQEVLAKLIGDIPDIEGTGFKQSEVDEILQSANISAGDLDIDIPDFDPADLEQRAEERQKELPERERVKQGESDEKAKAQQSRGADRPEPVDDEVELEKIPVDAQLQVVLEMNEEKLWRGNNRWDVPDLTEDMLMQADEFPDNVQTWGGKDATPDDGDKWFLYNYGLGGRSGLPMDRTITMFNCVDTETEALTQRGWLKYDEIGTDDTILSMDPQTKELHWSTVKSVFRRHYTGKMHQLRGSAMDALVSPNHKFATTDGDLKPVEDLKALDRIQVMGMPENGIQTPQAVLSPCCNASVRYGMGGRLYCDKCGEEVVFKQGGERSVYSDAFVELVGWAVTEGYFGLYHRKRDGGFTRHVTISQNPGATADRIVTAMKMAGAQWSESWAGKEQGCLAFKITGAVADALHEVVPDEHAMSYDFMLKLSSYQRDLLIETMIDGDGTRTGINGRVYCQKDKAHMERFTMLCAMQGIATTTRLRKWQTNPNGTKVYDTEIYYCVLKVRKTAKVHALDWNGGRDHVRQGIATAQNEPTVDYDDVIWCPETEYGTWVCRRAGKVYVTGNTHDRKFLSWWDTPAYMTSKFMVMGLKYICVPDFSFYYSDPSVQHLWSVYRAQWMGRFFQEAGLKVIPRLQFDYTNEECLDFNMLGIPKNPPLLITSQQNVENEDENGPKIAKMLEHCLNEIQPGKLIYYSGPPGKRIMEGTGWKGDVVYVENYAAVRRGQVFDKKEGKKRLTAKQRRAIEDKQYEKAGVERPKRSKVDPRLSEDEVVEQEESRKR